MKIVVTSTGKDLNSDIDQRFARAPYFLIVDPETQEYEAVENIQNVNLPQGAGIQAGQTIIKNNVNVVITGNCGPNAFKVLNKAGISVVVGAKGKVKDAISRYQKGELKATQDPNVEGHWV